MSCRGKGVRKPVDRPARAVMPQAHTQVIYFQYLGTAGITVIGPVTGRAYRFPARGATAATDPRDASSLTVVPYLVRVPPLSAQP